MVTVTKSVDIPAIEVLAAFRQSYLTAEKEGFHRTAKQVQGYLKDLVAIHDASKGKSFTISVTYEEGE